MRKIKAKDQVIVLAGKDKGKTGAVVQVLGSHAIVEGVNMVKRHTRGNPQQEIPGGIIEKEKPIDISNIAILNPQTGKADRVGFKVLEDKKGKVRIFKSTGEVIDV